MEAIVAEVIREGDNSKAIDAIKKRKQLLQEAGGEGYSKVPEDNQNSVMGWLEDQIKKKEVIEKKQGKGEKMKGWWPW